jgi:hypothetical protein
MNRKSAISHCLVGGLLLISAVCSAQYRPTASAAVDSVRANGFYRVLLPPALVARCRADLSDLRVYDQEGRETPYVLKTYGPDELNPSYRAIPHSRMLQKDSSNRHTYLRLQYDDAYLIDGLAFGIGSPVLYKREAVISSLDDGRIVATISIDPTDTVFRLRRAKTKGLLIDISNNDNPPLVIRQATAWQADIFVVALLQAGRQYRLVAGDPSVLAPDYDLHYFTDSLVAAPPVLWLGAVHRENGVTVMTVPEPGERKGGRSGLLLWSIVAAVLVLLLYVSIKLARAVDKKEES